MHILLTLAMTAALSAWGAEPRPEPAQPKRPNLILISIDTLRPDHLSCLGYKRPTSPMLDQFAAGGALFRRAYSTSSWTCPSHASVFTGVYPPVHKVNETTDKLAPNWPTLARQLKALGYSTKAIISGPMVNRSHGFDQGFDNFDDRTYLEKVDFKKSVKQKDREEILLYKTRLAPQIREVAEFWLSMPKRDPWFLFLHFWDVHADYKAPSPYDSIYDPSYRGKIDGTIKTPLVQQGMDPRDLQNFIARYDGEITWTDQHVGGFLNTVSKLGMDENTCVMIMSDHGEEFFEFGTKGHAHNLHDVLTRVVLMARWPGHIRAGLSVDTPVSLADVAPTLVELAGGTPPPWTQGRSLAPLLLGEIQSLPSIPIYGTLFSRDREQRYLLDYPFKLIQDLVAEKLHLYNIASDPGEKSDLAISIPESAESRLEDLSAWLEECRQVRSEIVGPFGP